MPQPYSTYLKPGQQPEYSSDWTANPFLAVQIIGLLGDYSYIDVGYGLSFAGCLQTQAHLAGTMYNMMVNRSSPEPLVDAVANVYFDTDRLDIYYAIKAFGKRWRDHRNAMAHGMWMCSPHVGTDRALLISPKHWIQQGADYQMIQLLKASEGTKPFVHGWKPPFNPEEIMVYSGQELAAMRTEIREVIDAWLAFNSYLWPNSVAAKVENPLAKLFEVAAIREHVNARRAKRDEPPVSAEMAAAAPQESIAMSDTPSASDTHADNTPPTQ